MSPSSSYKNVFEISQKTGQFEWSLSLLIENYHLTDKSPLPETAFFWNVNLTIATHTEIRGKKIYLLAFSRVLCVHNFKIFLTLSSRSNKGGFISKTLIQLICNKVLLLKYYFSLQNLASLHTCYLNTCKQHIVMFFFSKFSREQPTELLHDFYVPQVHLNNTSHGSTLDKHRVSSKSTQVNFKEKKNKFTMGDGGRDHQPSGGEHQWFWIPGWHMHNPEMMLLPRGTQQDAGNWSDQPCRHDQCLAHSTGQVLVKLWRDKPLWHGWTQLAVGALRALITLGVRAYSCCGPRAKPIFPLSITISTKYQKKMSFKNRKMWL